MANRNDFDALFESEGIDDTPAKGARAAKRPQAERKLTERESLKQAEDGLDKAEAACIENKGKYCAVYGALRKAVHAVAPEFDQDAAEADDAAGSDADADED